MASEVINPKLTTFYVSARSTAIVLSVCVFLLLLCINFKKSVIYKIDNGSGSKQYSFNYLNMVRSYIIIGTIESGEIQLFSLSSTNMNSVDA